jgi:hypothetical protein
MIKFLFLIIAAVILLSSCFSYSRTGDVCPTCAGNRKCNYCFGLGFTDKNAKCVICGGSGKCGACGGTGILMRSVDFTGTRKERERRAAAPVLFVCYCSGTN